MSLFQTKEKDGTISMRVCGYVPKDPRIYEKFALLSVCYGKKKYMDVKVWASNRDTLGMASCLEAHDSVAIDGVYETYTGKDDKAHGQIVADFISVMGAPASAASAEDAAQRNVEPSSELPEGFTEEDEGTLPF